MIQPAEKSTIVTLSCCCFNKSQFQKADVVLPQAWHSLAENWIEYLTSATLR
ncbi:MAG: hypothetical protein ACT6RN_07990 [Agrobacterium sp.]|uniref:hypothetical protein n=1 Tax=Agrobacterium sp. TaxID=361 RepID=UPI0040377470